MDEWMALQAKKVATTDARAKVEEAVIIPEVAELLKNRNRNAGFNGLDLNAFISDDNEGIQQTRLPDFDDVKARRAARAKDGSSGLGPTGQKEASPLVPPEDQSPVERAFKTLGAVLNPPMAPEKARASDDLFDKGLGLLVKNSVYACCAFLVLWEFYLASPVFDRKVPMLSIEEALVGYPVPAKPGVAGKPGGTALESPAPF